MSDRSSLQYTEILRADFCAFVHRSFIQLDPSTQFEANWHIEALADRLEQVRNGKINRLIINLPPRYLKSHIVSVTFPAWLMGHNPWAKLLCVSYQQGLAEKLARESRTLISSDFYQNLFPTRLSAAKQAADEFETTQGGYRLSTSVGGAITGRGADYIILDDPIDPESATSKDRRRDLLNAYQSTIVSRLNHKQGKGAIILVMHRLHGDDLVAQLQKTEPWDVLSLPAIAPDSRTIQMTSPYGIREKTLEAGEVLHPVRESSETLEAIKRRIGEYNFAAQYLQSPQPLEGNLVKRDMLKTYKWDEAPLPFDTIVQSWDTGIEVGPENSYSACTTWGIKDDHYYLFDVFCDRLKYPDLKAKVRELALKHHPRAVLIEKQSSGRQLLQDFEGNDIPVREAPSMDGNKEIRLATQTDKFADGRVHVLEGADWLDGYLNELTLFPHSEHSDRVDSTVFALEWVSRDRRMPGSGAYRYFTEEAPWVTPSPSRSRKKRYHAPPGNYQTLDGRSFSPDKNGILELDDADAMPYLRSGTIRPVVE